MQNICAFHSSSDYSSYLARKTHAPASVLPRVVPQGLAHCQGRSIASQQAALNPILAAVWRGKRALRQASRSGLCLRTSLIVKADRLRHNKPHDKRSVLLPGPFWQRPHYLMRKLYRYIHSSLIFYIHFKSLIYLRAFMACINEINSKIITQHWRCHITT